MIINRKEIKKDSHKNLRSTYLKSILVIFDFTLVMTVAYNYTSSLANNYNNDNITLNEIKNNFNMINSLITSEIK